MVGHWEKDRVSALNDIRPSSVAIYPAETLFVLRSMHFNQTSIYGYTISVVRLLSD